MGQSPAAERPSSPSSPCRPPCIRSVLLASALGTETNPRPLHTSPLLFQGKGVAEVVSCRAIVARILQSPHWEKVWGEMESALE